eukprot:9483567-Pyramimonas_sp.AAC.1
MARNGGGKAWSTAWTCCDKRCGFPRNFPWRATCWACGAAKPAGPAERQPRPPSGAWVRPPRLQPQGGAAGAGGAGGDKLNPERKAALLAMSQEHFEACSFWLSP